MMRIVTALVMFAIPGTLRAADATIDLSQALVLTPPALALPEQTAVRMLIEEVEKFALSFDGSKELYEAGKDGHSYGIIDAKPESQPPASAHASAVRVKRPTTTGAASATSSSVMSRSRRST